MTTTIYNINFYLVITVSNSLLRRGEGAHDSSIVCPIRSNYCMQIRTSTIHLRNIFVPFSCFSFSRHRLVTFSSGAGERFVCHAT